MKLIHESPPLTRVTFLSINPQVNIALFSSCHLLKIDKYGHSLESALGNYELTVIGGSLVHGVSLCPVTFPAHFVEISRGVKLCL